MRFNRNGSYVAGVAGASTAVNGQELVPGRCCGGWFWLTDSIVAGQVCGDDCQIIDQTGRMLLDHGANFFAAGGGRWASRLDGVRGLESNFTSGPEYLGASPLWIDADGLAAIVMSYYDGGPIRLIRADGSIQDFPVVIFGRLYSGESCVKVNDGLLTFRTDSGWHIWDDRSRQFVPNARPMDADDFMACRVGSDVIVIERMATDASVQVRRAQVSDAITVGTYIGPGQETYYTSICSLPGGRVRAGFSRSITDLAVQLKDLSVSDIPGAINTTPIDRKISIVRKIDGETVAVIAMSAIAGYMILTDKP